MFKDSKKKRIYSIWYSMKKRCNNPKTNSYERYGGRNISYCDEWEKFSNFFNWAISNGYDEDLTLDRIDNDKNYEPNNCRWVTWKEQANHKSTNRLIKSCGKTQTISQWAEELNINKNTLKGRLDNNWDISKALYTIPQNNDLINIIPQNVIQRYFNSFLSYQQKDNNTLKELSKNSGLLYSTLNKWKNGKHMPLYCDLKKSLSIINISTLDFLGDYDEVYKSGIFSNTDFILYYIDNNNIFTLSDFNKYLNVKKPYTYIQNLINKGYDIKIIEKSNKGNIYYYNPK